MSTPTTFRLTSLHTRYQFIETIRVPIAVIGTTLFPSLSLLFFVVPQSFAQDPTQATAAAAQLAVFAVMSVCLFTYGVGVAEDRALPWDGYLRTLPLSRLALSAAALLAAGVPLFALGITIGYSLSTKAAMAVAQSLLLPLAFGGGLFLPPNTFPGWLDAISTWLPTRAGRDLVVTATTGTDLPGTTLLMLGGWTLLTGSLAVWAYRRDEGRRFR
jgi:ABC-2 type transport system permease protein